MIGLVASIVAGFGLFYVLLRLGLVDLIIDIIEAIFDAFGDD